MTDDVQRRRARQYAVCTYALANDPVTHGAEGVFDQALTNGLAAIVAAEWAGDELNGPGRVLSASGLLDVIEQRGTAAERGIVRVLPAGEPEWIPAPDDGQPMANFTAVDVDALRNALAVSQAVRHARDLAGAAAPELTARHIEALRDLEHHPTLFVFSDEAMERAESLIHTDIAEQARASAYYHRLGDQERARREAIDYAEEHAWATAVEQCPVCSNRALVASAFDGWLEEIGIGTCVACSYVRSADIADEIARVEDLDRMLERHRDD